MKPPNKAILVRVAVDHSYGGWNAPVDPESRRFLYVPIPEKSGTAFHKGCRRSYRDLVPTIDAFARQFDLDAVRDLRWPKALERQSMHLDPDFESMTYGDVGDRRGSHIRDMQHGDLILFYAGLRPLRPDSQKLIYALIGQIVVDEIVPASEVPPARWDENAHTRKKKRGESDIVVRGQPDLSGRYSRCIPIGEFRNRAYRVRDDILRAWGGLTVRDGFIQRSARPPRFLNPPRVWSWLQKQDVSLLALNNEPPAPDQVVVVILRQPQQSDPNETRADPFWEFGSFGCTGCHSRNLLHTKRADELEGVRLAFAQGGPSGFRLVHLTPPVTVIRHENRIELRWTLARMPFRYAAAPLLVDNEGQTDFPSIMPVLAHVDRETWMAQFASRFRSRRNPVGEQLARELVANFARLRRTSDESTIAESYVEALPHPPTCIDQHRERTYAKLVSSMQRASQNQSCGGTGTRQPKRRPRGNDSRNC